MMIKLKLLELREQLEVAGWELIDDYEMFLASDDTIEWNLMNIRLSSKEVLTFFLFDNLGKRTDKLSDILYVTRSKDSATLYFDKKDKDWKRKAKEFAFTMK